MQKLLALLLFVSLAAQANPSRIALSVQPKIPSAFDTSPDVDTVQGGVSTQIWTTPDDAWQDSPILLQIQTKPSSQADNLDAVFRPTKDSLKTCELREKTATAPIFAKGMKDTGAKTNEKILSFSCAKSEKMGVYRFIEGTGNYGDTLLVLAYMSDKNVPLSQTEAQMEQALREMKVVVASDFPAPKKKPTP